MFDAFTTKSGLLAMRLDPVTLASSDLAAWTDLADRAADPNPFFRPGLIVPDAEERGRSITLAVIRDGERWLACLPLRRRQPSRNIPLPHLEGAVDAYTLFGSPLLDRTRLDAVADAFIELVRAQRGAATVALPMFDPDAATGIALLAAATRQGVRSAVLQTADRAAWRRPADLEHAGAKPKRSDRKELARRDRLLTAELGQPAVIVDRTTEPAAWEAFLAMEDTGWKSEHGTAMRSRPGDAAFFRRMCAEMSSSGHLELVSLEGGGRSVAMECHLVDGTTLFSFKIAHDPAFRRFSPGSQLKVRVIDRLAEQGFTLGDSCASPTNAHMNRLWPDRRRIQTLLLPTGATSRHLVRPAVWGKSVARRLRDDVIRVGVGAVANPR
jgi:CelD/BcsL family acetyltransferase involved in cellulose biosynthesis